MRKISPDTEALPGMRCDLDSSNLAKAMVNASGDAAGDLGLFMLEGALCWVGYNCSCEEAARKQWSEVPMGMMARASFGEKPSLGLPENSTTHYSKRHSIPMLTCQIRS